MGNGKESEKYMHSKHNLTKMWINVQQVQIHVPLHFAENLIISKGCTMFWMKDAEKYIVLTYINI